MVFFLFRHLDVFVARLANLLRRYNVNDYAARVKVYAVKPDDAGR